MAICTYLRQDEFEKYTKVTDTDINELLQEVRRDITSKILIQERVFIKKRVFRKDLPTTLYAVYYDLGNPEVQMINFCGNTEGFNTYILKSTLINYLLGIIAGYKYGIEKNNNQHKYTDRQNDN